MMFLEFHTMSEPWSIHVSKREDLLILYDSERKVTGAFHFKICFS